MKKLIAMLLCIAMVAALGVSAFALSDEDAKALEDLKITNAKAAKKPYETRIDMLEAVEQVYRDALQMVVDGKKQADVEEWGQDALDAIYDSNPTLAEALKGECHGGSNPWNFVYASVVDGAGLTYYDVDIDWFQANRVDPQDAIIKAAQKESDKYAKKIAEAATKAADEAAAKKLEEAAVKAAEAAVKNPKTSADWLLYWAAYNQVKENAKLGTAKKAAETAKKSVAVAQQGAVAAAKAAVTEAQVVAYNNMQSEITKAVNEYVTGVNAAIAEYIAGLAE